jgi:predicted GIY-YIG superfamily endonuclease
VYTVYKLLDEDGFVFYVGFTKNFKIRMYEHGLLQGKNKKKDRKIEKVKRIKGFLPVSFEEFSTIEDATEEEKRLIAKYRPQLTNKHSGGNYVGHFIRPKTKTVKRRSKCPTCGKLFMQLSRHKCKGVKND